MKLLLAIALISLIALIGSRLTFFSRRLTMGLKNIIFTGTEYIFLGFFLGSWGLNILDIETLKKLEPFLLFGLSWIGFLFGLQFEVKRLKVLPRRYFSITAIQSFIVFVLVSSAAWIALKFFQLLPEHLILLASITLGSSASCTAQSAIAIVNHNFRIENRGLLELMRYISSVDGLFALLFFAAALCILPNGGLVSFGFLKSLGWLTVSIAMGVLPALVLIFLSSTRFTQQEYMVFLIGVIMFCGGLAERLHYSSLVAGLVCGIVTANFCPHRLRALSIVVHAEKSIYISLLILLGAGWQFKAGAVLIVAAVYFFSRLVGKIIGVFTATKIFKPKYKVPPQLGLGLISEGGLAVAIIINVTLLYPVLSDSLITIIVLSVIVNEYISPALIVKQLGDVLHFAEDRFQKVKDHEADTE